MTLFCSIYWMIVEIRNLEVFNRVPATCILLHLDFIFFLYTSPWYRFCIFEKGGSGLICLMLHFLNCMSYKFNCFMKAWNSLDKGYNKSVLWLIDWLIFVILRNDSNKLEAGYGVALLKPQMIKHSEIMIHITQIYSFPITAFFYSTTFPLN